MLTRAIATLAAATAAAFLPVAHAKPEQIRGVQDPIYHLYLQAHPDDPTLPVMGPEATSDFFTIGGTIQSTNSSAYLTVAAGDASYKTLRFADSSAGGDVWALEGDTIITGQGSSWGRQLNFLACKYDATYWEVYLQTGSAMPSGRTCSNYQTLHLPCLC